jgi:hypothetical protein
MTPLYYSGTEYGLGIDVGGMDPILVLNHILWILYLGPWLS